MFHGLSTFRKHGYRKQCFLVCPPSGNMARKQCFPVCPPVGNMARKQCFLLCPPLGNMTRKQCFLVCPPLGNMARKQCFLLCPRLYMELCMLMKLLSYFSTSHCVCVTLSRFLVKYSFSSAPYSSPHIVNFQNQRTLNII